MKILRIICRRFLEREAKYRELIIEALDKGDWDTAYFLMKERDA